MVLPLLDNEQLTDNYKQNMDDMIKCPAEYSKVVLFRARRLATHFFFEKHPTLKKFWERPFSTKTTHQLLR